MIHTKSNQYYQEAIKLIPGGVDSPVRSFSNVGSAPLFIDHAQKEQVIDVDGNHYIDYIGSWGPMILGHAHPLLTQGIQEVVDKGISYGLCCPAEIELARLITEAYQGIDMVRMVNSGTEATMSAIRVARAYTKRNKVIKFEGCYHGHNDCLLVKSGSGTLTYGMPTSLGIPEDIVKHTLVANYNDIASVEACIKANQHDVACIIIEPVAGNMGVVPAQPSFLKALRELCDNHQILLIFDEVITGFRLTYGGAQEYYNIQPDMACFGKIIGGGLPVGAYGGKREVMSLVSPQGPVYQAGTLSGNPLAMHLGVRLLTYLKEHQELYDELSMKGAYMKKEMDKMLEELHIPHQLHQCGSLLTLFFSAKEIRTYEDVKHSDQQRFATYFQYLLDHGILIAPSNFEAMFLSTAHTKQVINDTLAIMKDAFRTLL